MKSEKNNLTIKNRSIQKIAFEKYNNCFIIFLFIVFLILSAFMHFFIIDKININKKLINEILNISQIYTISGNVNKIKLKYSYNNKIEKKN